VVGETISAKKIGGASIRSRAPPDAHNLRRCAGPALGDLLLFGTAHNLFDDTPGFEQQQRGDSCTRYFPAEFRAHHRLAVMTLSFPA